MDNQVTLTFYVRPTGDIKNIDPTKALEKFSIDFPKWNIPKVGEQIVVVNDNTSQFYAVVDKMFTITDGKELDVFYFVQPHGKHGEFEHLYNK